MKELYIKKEECCGCGACVDVCPKGAVRMAVDQEGFRYPRIDGKLCIDCRRCEQVCPVKEPEEQKSAGKAVGKARQYFGVQAKEKKTRYESSSGGMFPVLAEYVLKRQGVVYGASYGRDMRVVHREIRSLEKLDCIKRTKYVQSSLKGIYKRAEKHLKADRWVLFCGTPCQAKGLMLYLKKSYPKLLVADLVCYGAPSPGVWRDYVKYLEKKRGGPVTDFSFRDKRMGDSGHTCAYVAGGKEYTGSLYADVYCRMYFSDHIIRPSCHECRFCTVERDSDFTIGDFWGLEKVKPEMDDGMGTSMVIVHTEKAKKVWEEVKGSLSWFECEEKDVLQPRLTGAVSAARSRGIFMMLYRLLPFSVFYTGYLASASGAALLKRIGAACGHAINFGGETT